MVALAFQSLTLPACAQPTKGGTATDPVPSTGPWLDLHESYVRQAARGDVDLLFLGDSITQGWNNNRVWQRFYTPRRAANFGIGGDRTQHVLWRLGHGEVDSIRPKVVVLLIGTNNIGANTNEEVYEGVKAIIETLRTKLPETRVLLLGILPKGRTRPRDAETDEVDPRVAAVNQRIATLDDGKLIRYLDLGPTFLNADGKIPRELMADFLHLSTRGYRAWADAMEPTLWEMLENR
jgi:lysophospholipase L1-like esterase